MPCSKKLLSFASWNVNGFRSVLKKGFFEWLEQCEHDVVCLQEIRVLPEQLKDEEMLFKGFESVVWNPAERKGYAGTLTASRKAPRSISTKLGREDFDCEGRYIESDHGEVVLINVYVPNGKNDLSRVSFKLEFYQSMLNRIQELHKEGRRVLVTGDWNTCHRPIDLARPKNNEKNTGFLPEERAWIDTFTSSGLFDSFRQEYPDLEGAYSWWSQRAGAREKNIGWRLDYFLASDELKSRLFKNQIHDQQLGSDHCPVSVALSL